MPPQITPDQRKDAASKIFLEALLKIHELCVEVTITCASHDGNFDQSLVSRQDTPESLVEMWSVGFTPYVPESVGRTELSVGAALARETPSPLTISGANALSLYRAVHRLLIGEAQGKWNLAYAHKYPLPRAETPQEEHLRAKELLDVRSALIHAHDAVAKDQVS